MMRTSSTSSRSWLLSAGAFACAFAVAFFWQIEARAEAATRPNVVVIQVDDMAKAQMRAKVKQRGRWVPVMPNLLREVVGQGIEFSRYYVSNPICGPSRASLLTGRSTHNHGMRINVAPWGYPYWQGSEISRENLAVWLQRDGYRTIHIGKYTNGYGATPDNEIPAGWERWAGQTRQGSTYYGNSWNINGLVTPPLGSWQIPDLPGCRIATLDVPGGCLHATDLQTAYAVDELEKSASDSRPFYLQLDYNAPHDDGRRQPGPTPPPRVAGLAAHTPAPRGLDQVEVSASQPLFIRDQAPATPDMRRNIRQGWRNEVASLRAVDQGIGRVFRELRASGRLADTYVIFISDNGFFHGEHRLSYGKYLPHEPATRQPLLIRGPGVARKRFTPVLGSNLDLAPTVLSMTGATAGAWRDGRSLLPFARNPFRTSKVPVLLEGFNGRGPEQPELFLDGSGQSRPNQAVVLNYTGLVAGYWKFVSYSYGEEELYDLYSDPGETVNLVNRPRYARVARWGRNHAARLATCVAAQCRLPVNVPRGP